MARRHDRHPAPQSKRFLRGAWLVAEIFHAGPEKGDWRAPAGPHHVRLGLADIDAGTSARRLASARLSGRRLRKNFSPQCRGFLPRRSSKVKASMADIALLAERLRKIAASEHVKPTELS